MFAILKCCAWIQIVKQACPRLKNSPQTSASCLQTYTRWENMKTWLKVRVYGGDHAMQHTPHTHWLSGHSNTTNIRDKYSWQWPELLIIYIMYF